MPEIIIKYKTSETLKALKEIAKYFDFTIEKAISKNQTPVSDKKTELPISFAKNPDISALAGIWKNKEITLSDLRKKAWE